MILNKGDKLIDDKGDVVEVIGHDPRLTEVLVAYSGPAWPLPKFPMFWLSRLTVERYTHQRDASLLECIIFDLK